MVVRFAMLMFVIMMVLMIMVMFMIMVALLLLIMVVLVLVAMVFVIMVVFMVGRRFTGFPGYQVHATFRAAARLVFDNFRMHGADILDPGVQNR
ncbi:hypothetical protein DIT71_02540 [Marinobacter vulgaris]|uniref:Uncharacterized protein n=1 Tax=Marinobacter vulgaris TaxID=1928331 RepID=A0A2V3ZQU7_9GAMM|nr:hypothetical protein DIT71_02540 [Marinobacter vulgaris]